MSIKISNLPTANTLIATDYFIIDNNEQTSKISASDLFKNTVELTRVTLSSTDTSFVVQDNQSGILITYSNTSNITAYITPHINTTNFVTTLAQLSSGTITVGLSSSYTDGNLISYGDLFETAGKGSTVNITRVSNNNFLITGLLQ
jgi:hypothetical protein